MKQERKNNKLLNEREVTHKYRKHVFMCFEFFLSVKLSPLISICLVLTILVWTALGSFVAAKGKTARQEGLKMNTMVVLGRNWLKLKFLSASALVKVRLSHLDNSNEKMLQSVQVCQDM